jgi:hypothetical protein
MLLNEYEIEFMFRKIRNIRNLGNFYIRGPSHCYRTDAQNGLDFHFNVYNTYRIGITHARLNDAMLIINKNKKNDSLIVMYL